MSEFDSVDQFISECLIIHLEDLQYKNRDLKRNRPKFYNTYCSFCKLNHFIPVDKYRFNDLLLEYRVTIDNVEYRINPYYHKPYIKGYTNIEVKPEWIEYYI